MFTQHIRTGAQYSADELNNSNDVVKHTAYFVLQSRYNVCTILLFLFACECIETKYSFNLFVDSKSIRLTYKIFTIKSFIKCLRKMILLIWQN